MSLFKLQEIFYLCKLTVNKTFHQNYCFMLKRLKLWYPILYKSSRIFKDYIKIFNEIKPL